MNVHDVSYARYITIGAVALLVIIIGVWIYRSMPRGDNNANPRTGFVCMDTRCSVKKKCDATTLVIYTQLPTVDEPTKQRISNSYECQAR